MARSAKSNSSSGRGAGGRVVGALLLPVGVGVVYSHPKATCHQVTAAGIRVFPSGETRATLIPFPLRACSRNGPVVGAVGNG